MKYVKKYISIVSIEAATNNIVKSIKAKRVTFTDQLGTIGGTLGLFSGISILSVIEILFCVARLFKNVMMDKIPG